MDDGRMTRRRFVELGSALGLAAAGARLGLSAPAALAEGPRGRIGEDMGRILVVYGTKSGCTAGVAERIGKALAEAGAAVEVVPGDKAGSVAHYGAVVVGSGVRMGKWHEPVRTWVGDQASALKSRPVAFYTVGLRISEPGRAGEVRAYTDPLIKQTGVHPVDIGLFAGWNVPTGFSLIERLVLKAMKAPVGDFRDWTAIDAWGAKALQAFRS